LGHLTKVSDGTREVSYAYDGNNNLVRYSDPESLVFEYLYEESRAACGFWTATRFPGNHIPSQLEYDEKGRVSKLKDTEDNLYAYTYDESLTTVSFPTGGNNPPTSQKFAHNAKGQLVAFTDENQNTACFTYDSKGRMETISDHHNPPRVTRYTYHEPSSHFASATQFPENVGTEYHYVKHSSDGVDYYDLSEIIHADLTKESFTNDASGNLIDWTDQNTNKWEYSFNERGQVLTADNPEGGRTTYTYNQDGSTSTISDHSDNTVTLS
jgi:YD repeat-containing protein